MDFEPRDLALQPKSTLEILAMFGAFPDYEAPADSAPRHLL